MRTEAAYKYDETDERSVDHHDCLYMECVDNSWQPRNRDLNNAISLLRPLTTNLEERRDWRP